MRAKHWPRAIILVDMNAFFAAIEQRDHPKWRSRPLAVTNGRTGTCIITSSYEARAHGVKTGMRLKEGRERCPGLIQCPARPGRYAEISTAIMSALQDITPDMEVFSVDEAFLDVTRCQQLLGSPERIARLAKRKVFEASGLLCSAGVSGDKTTAKYAAKLNKPDGLTVIPPWEAKARLHDVPVTDLCGINRGIGAFLAARGIFTCGDMAQLPIGVLAQRFGNPGRRIWYMAQGADPEPLHPDVPPPKSYPRRRGDPHLLTPHERKGGGTAATPYDGGTGVRHWPARTGWLARCPGAERPAHPRWSDHHGPVCRGDRSPLARTGRASGTGHGPRSPPESRPAGVIR